MATPKTIKFVRYALMLFSTGLFVAAFFWYTTGFTRVAISFISTGLLSLAVSINPAPLIDNIKRQRLPMILIATFLTLFLGFVMFNILDPTDFFKVFPPSHQPWHNKFGSGNGWHNQE